MGAGSGSFAESLGCGCSGSRYSPVRGSITLQLFLQKTSEVSLSSNEVYEYRNMYLDAALLCKLSMALVFSHDELMAC
jgi:hypothetical protein